ncbi:MAG TPA: glycosyl hydrolase, partial [Dehalococcoidia bacterium]|nr:glycosyl hydrolase [Dehalococcoidia bacterium]
MRVNLPVAPVYDIIVKDDDLVAATHGRSFWIMDDLTQLRQLTGDVASQSVRLLKPGPAYRLAPTSGRGKPSTYKNYQLGLGAVATYTESSDVTGQTVRKLLDSGQNPPGGVRIHYWLAEQPDGDITLSFLDKDGAEIKAFTSAEPESESDDGPPEAHLTKTAGLNRFDWNIRYADAHKVPGDKTTTGALTGPKAPPGTYSVRLTV